MENLNLTIAKNLISVRKSQNLTQLELAEKLNYSDKSISKWEKGEAIPSMEVLAKLSELFNVPVDYFVRETAIAPKTIPNKKRKNKLIITLLSLSLVWFTAIVLFSVFTIVFSLNLWTIFIWAVPASCVITTVFSWLWSPRRRYIYISVSLLIWTLITGFFFQFLTANLWMLYLIGVPLQVVVILWAFLRKN